MRSPPKLRRKRAPRTMEFTELGLRRLSTRTALANAGKASQVQIWDKGTNGQRGLSVLASRGGAKTYLATFYLRGRAVTAKLGRVGDMGLTDARALTSEYRAKAREGIDPRQQRAKGRESKPPHAAPGTAGAGTTYREVVERFVELYAKPRQRSWDDTRRILTANCAAWLDRDITDITKKDAFALLDRFVKEGQVAKADVTQAWIRKLWRWAAIRDIVGAPIMDAVEIEYQKQKPPRFYSDEEVKAIWAAADRVDPIEGGYVKLLLLLAPRKRELALMKRHHLDSMETPTLWTTPFELTKARKTTRGARAYLTPLPPLAQRILKPLLKGEGDRVFPILPIYTTPAGRLWFDSSQLTKRLIKHGAPADFSCHAFRHTLATWLQTAGHSEWECGLVLNHSGASVTAGYSHGYPLELKRSLLEKWAEHVERQVAAAGVAVLR